MNKELLVAAIKDGTMIDHIPSSRIFDVVRVLGLSRLTSSIMVGCNLRSSKMGTKSIIKVADKFFTDDELNRLSVVAPNVTLCIIRDYEVVEKKRVELPRELRGVVRCANPKCITNNEPMPTRFHTIADEGGGEPVLKCHYCEWEQRLHEVKIADRP